MTEKALNESFGAGTLSETINGLNKLGYTHDFNIQEECLVCQQTNDTLSPEEFQIDKVYRFEGASNPEDQSILYAISSAKYNLKGVLVNGYGLSSDEATSKLIEKLRTNTVTTKSVVRSQQKEGQEILDNPLLEINLPMLIDQVKKEASWINTDRGSVVIFKSETMRIVLMGLKENAELKPHKANGRISVQLLEGKINFGQEQENYVLEKGQMIVLEENRTHNVKAVSDSFFLITLAAKN